MGKGIFSLSTLLLMLLFLQCAGTHEADPEVSASCKLKCSNAYDGCVKKAVKNQAKKAACEAVMNKCENDCDLPPENVKLKNIKNNTK